MFPALFSISLGLLLGDLAHHWIYNWAYWWDTWIILGVAGIVLFFAWWNADDDSLMDNTDRSHKKQDHTHIH